MFKSYSKGKELANTFWNTQNIDRRFCYIFVFGGVTSLLI